MFTLDIPTILANLRPDEQWVVRGDQKDYANLDWKDAAPKPTEQEMLDVELAAAKTDRTSKVKVEARDRCLTAVPDWKQWNIGRGSYNQATMDTLNGLIDTIRTDSDTAETAIAALGTVQACIDFTW